MRWRGEVARQAEQAGAAAERFDREAGKPFRGRIDEGEIGVVAEVLPVPGQPRLVGEDAGDRLGEVSLFSVISMTRSLPAASWTA